MDEVAPDVTNSVGEPAPVAGAGEVVPAPQAPAQEQVQTEVQTIHEAPAALETPSVSSPQAETAQSATSTAHFFPNEPLPVKAEPFSPPPSPTSPPANVTAEGYEGHSAAAVTPVSGIFHTVRDVLTKAREKIQFRKRAKLDKILKVLETKGSITNDEVEKLLRVSDATATRYLSALEKEGKIVQTGRTGAGVRYSKI